FTVLCNLKIFLIIKHENASFLFIILEKETFLKVFLKNRIDRVVFQHSEKKRGDSPLFFLCGKSIDFIVLLTSLLG
ncbi:hypothetical protein, partial [Bacillus cytotoxicus]